MNKEIDHSEDYIHLRHVAKQDESYFLTVFDDNGWQTINLLDSGKNKLTFGKAPNNDIVLSSDLIDLNQGYLEINEYGVLAVNTSPHIPLIGNNNKIFDNEYLSDGNFVKIIDTNSQTSTGILMIMSISRSPDEWKQFPITSSKLTIGSSGSCDVILSPNTVDSHHCTIYNSSNKLSILDEFSNLGTYVNGIKLNPSKESQLRNLDVILVGNSKLVLSGNKLYYQIFERGIRLEAFDIVKKVKSKFKIRQISSHVSMKVNPSEFVAFVGGSGAGKSTFLKCISGLDKPTSGKVLLNGEDLYENYSDLKHNIGYVPQDDIVFSDLTLHDMLHYAAKLRMPDSASAREREARIKEVLDIVELTDFENSYIRQLSGGQRKRSSIAVELIADPNILFLDEPTSGLDPGTERKIMYTLKKMSQMGKTIILVTHTTLNLHICDKIAFFGPGGYLCFYGTPQEALDFFEVDDFVDIYNLISDNLDFWINKFQNTQKTERNPSQPYSKNSKIINKKKSFFRQLFNLISRNIKLVTNNVFQLLILFAEAPIIALLISLISDSTVFENYTVTRGIVFTLSCAAVWIGFFNTIQEVCKEKVILQKEHMADLSLSAYLLAKFIVQIIFSVIQAFLFVFTFQKLVGVSDYSILFGSFGDILLICFLTILSSAAMGLFFSCLMTNNNMVTVMLPLIMLPQLLFSGILIELKGIAVYLSTITLSRWCAEGIGSSFNLNTLTHEIQAINPFIQIEPEKYYIFTADHMIQTIAILLGMTLFFIVGGYIALRKNVDKTI